MKITIDSNGPITVPPQLESEIKRIFMKIMFPPAPKKQYTLPKSVKPWKAEEEEKLRSIIKTEPADSIHSMKFYARIGRDFGRTAFSVAARVNKLRKQGII